MQWAKIHPVIKQYFKCILHFPNEGKRTSRFGAKLKSMGMRKGVVDLFIAVPKRGYGGAWIELKSAKGIVKPEQKQFLEDMAAQNFYTSVCWSIEEAITCLSWYLLP